MESDSEEISWAYRSTHQGTMEVGVCEDHFHNSLSPHLKIKFVCTFLFCTLCHLSLSVCLSIPRELQKKGGSRSVNALPHGQRSIMVGNKRVQATVNTEGAINRSGRKKRIRNKRLIALTQEEYNDAVTNANNLTQQESNKETMMEVSI